MYDMVESRASDLAQVLHDRAKAKMGTLEQSLKIAVEAHTGQVDMAGQPYVFHPIRMALRLDDEDEKIVALLHDVVEDCKGWTFDRIAAHGFEPHIVEALQSVTKDIGSDLSDEQVYMDFIRRAAANPIGIAVKRADLMDNLDVSRITQPTERDYDRIAKYRRALEILDAADRRGG